MIKILQNRRVAKQAAVQMQAIYMWRATTRRR